MRTCRCKEKRKGKGARRWGGGGRLKDVVRRPPRATISGQGVKAVPKLHKYCRGRDLRQRPAHLLSPRHLPRTLGTLRKGRRGGRENIAQRQNPSLLSKHIRLFMIAQSLLYLFNFQIKNMLMSFIFLRHTLLTHTFIHRAHAEQPMRASTYTTKTILYLQHIH